MYRLNEDKMFYDAEEGQAVIINFTTGMYYTTTSLGSVILERLLNGNDPDEIAKAVKGLPGCPNDFGTQLNAFIEELGAKEILVVGEAVPGGNEPIPDGALADGFELKLEEFSEVQDLILADPVHDLNDEDANP